MKVLLVSKPLSAPWNDSGKNWARDIARFASQSGVEHHILVPRNEKSWGGTPGVVAEPIYRGSGRFSPRYLDNARAMRRLLTRGLCDVVHFCFAPNRRTNTLARAAMLRRRQPSLHTVLSVPADFSGIDRILFANRIVCVSRSTADKLVQAGVKRVEVVPASIPVEAPLALRDAPRLARCARRLGLVSGRPLVVFPGDYEFSRAADTFAEAVRILWKRCDADFVFACRIKRPASLQRETHFKHLLAQPHQQGRVHFFRNVGDIRALLALAYLVVMPAESNYAKMDIPLVILEPLAEQTPVILADVLPLRESLGNHPAEGGGLLVPPLDPHKLAARIAELVSDRTAQRDLGLAGRAHVERRHDAAKVCRRYTEIYRAL